MSMAPAAPGSSQLVALDRDHSYTRPPFLSPTLLPNQRHHEPQSGPAQPLDAPVESFPHTAWIAAKVRFRGSFRQFS